MNLKPGLRLKSAVCDAEIMVIKAGAAAAICCGGAPMHEGNGASSADRELDSKFADGCLMGKRYVSKDGSLEILCVKPGKGSLSLDDEPLEVKNAKSLPSSD